MYHENFSHHLRNFFHAINQYQIYKLNYLIIKNIDVADKNVSKLKTIQQSIELPQ